MLENKKDGKKKNPKARDTESPISTETGTAEVSRLISSLHDRLSALTFEVVGLRSEIAGGKSSAKGKRSETTAVKPSSMIVSPDALLGTLQAEAQAASTESGDTVAIVLTAFAQAPEGEDTETTAAQTTLLRMSPSLVRRSEGLTERETLLGERAARIAASLGAESRIALACLLLTEGTQTATELGTGADLTTGSLYHHLREMTHAGVLQVVSRNRYALTPLGRRALLSLLAFAQDAP